VHYSRDEDAARALLRLDRRALRRRERNLVKLPVTLVQTLSLPWENVGARGMERKTLTTMGSDVRELPLKVRCKGRV